MRSLKATGDSIKIGGLNGDEEVWLLYEPSPLKSGSFYLSASLEKGEIKLPG